MADSPDLWTPLGALIDAGVDVPETVWPQGAPPRPILDPRFPRWYRGRTHRTTIAGQQVEPSPGYFLFGVTDEDEVGIYNAEAGQDVEQPVHCWAGTPDDAVALYRWLKRLAHGVELTVVGYQPVALLFDRRGPMRNPQPDGTGWQVIATGRGEAMEAAA